LRSRSLPTRMRQIVTVGLSGDFLGLNALIVGTADFDHVAKTPAKPFRIR